MHLIVVNTTEELINLVEERLIYNEEFLRYCKSVIKDDLTGKKEFSVNSMFMFDLIGLYFQDLDIDLTNRIDTDELNDKTSKELYKVIRKYGLLENI